MIHLLHMSRQRALLQEFSTANCARMRDSTVKLSVIDELEFTCECGTAVSASEGIDGSVETRVHVQVLFLCKALTTILGIKESY